MRSIYSSMIVIGVLACSAEAPPGGSGSGGTGGSVTGGSGTVVSHGGSSPTSGGASAMGGTVSPSSGGAPTSGGSAMAGAAASGASATGGSSGAASGGASAMGGGNSLGGTSATGGNSSGGMMASGGASSGGSAGSAGSAGAGSDDAGVAKALDGARIDAPCAGSPAGTDGETCNHTVLMNNQFKATKEVTIAGTPGTSYDVTIRVRGVVEPTSINGGTRPDTSTFQYKNAMWRKVPYTIGGTVKAPDYQVWRISVAEPKQDYFLNDYQNTAHNVFELDYEVTFQISANSKVTLDVTDSNERQIVNYEKYALDGVAGSMNYGQFVQLNVVSVKKHEAGSTQ